MATPSKTSPDYDPIDEALDIGYGLGRKQERERQGPRVESARRGGTRHGKAQAKRDYDEKRRARAADRQRTKQIIKARKDAKREEEIASARRGSYRAGQADAKKAQADAAREARRQGASASQAPSPSAPKLSAPDTNLPLIGEIASGNLSRTTASRLIITATALSAIMVVIRDAKLSGPPAKTTVTVSGQVVSVPSHLRSLGGVIIAGTVSLIVAEVNPEIGLAMGFLLLVTVGSSVFTAPKGGKSIADQLGGAVFALPGTNQGTTGSAGIIGGSYSLPNVAPGVSASAAFPDGGSSQAGEAWIAAHPNTLPHPGLGASDFWNAWAINYAKQHGTTITTS